MEIDIEHLEFLSKLKIQEDKKQGFKKDLEKILDFVDEITKLELPDEDKTRAVGLDQLRKDQVKDGQEFNPLLNAPKQKDGCYQVPRVVE